MSAKWKRAIFLTFVVCANLMAIILNDIKAVLVSMSIVLCPMLFYWILKLSVPTYKKRDEVSAYIGKLTMSEKVESVITFIFILMLLVVWIIKIL
ncbi:MAG TPA: hypothetical protein DDW57_06285 [Erysipelotrichaceae bacterium]|uniref:hypothetical protein n=1 Tax=Sharpea azabuensis TaxID=322505 RepID=UPI000E7E3B46|nr:hypothetical protein [Sharpea azabuensis]HBG85428.1 hypothetical protein [Erysipelotrichaceae bacterium]